MAIAPNHSALALNAMQIRVGEKSYD